LIKVQKSKENLLKIISSDLQTQYKNLLKQDSEKLSNQEIPQQASNNLTAPETAPLRRGNQELNKRIKPLGLKVSEEFF
jgi:hypothetical protein